MQNSDAIAEYTNESDVELCKRVSNQLIRIYQIVGELSPDEFCVDGPSKPNPKRDADMERIAQLADQHGFDGGLFRDVSPQLNWNWDALKRAIRQLRQQIETLPRIIAAIEEPPVKKVTMRVTGTSLRDAVIALINDQCRCNLGKDWQDSQAGIEAINAMTQIIIEDLERQGEFVELV